MNIILFIIILAVLVLAHEFGHFIVAKRSGIRVDEFGIGFPPKLWGKKIGETEYTINLFPIGGFVKIFGETPDKDSIEGPESKRSFVNKPKYVQASVLVAGVVANIILAWLLISVGFMIGLPTPTSNVPQGRTLSNVALTITEVAPNSPAKTAGLKVGDVILSISSGKNTILNPSTTAVQKFIEDNSKNNINIDFRRGKKIEKTVSLRAVSGIINHPAIGIGMNEIGKLKLPVYLALYDGAKLTASLTQSTFLGLVGFLGGIFTGSADLSSVESPVCIAQTVGTVSTFGFIYLLYFTALISINLAIINLIPFPALDGGRLLFLFIEKIKGSPIKPKIANVINLIGFVLLIILMLAVVYNDIFIKIIAHGGCN